MKYPTEEPQVRLGDWIWCNEGVSVGIVSLILENEEHWSEWGLDEAGLFVCFDLSEKLLTQDQFVSEESFEKEGVCPLCHAEKVAIQELYNRVCGLHGIDKKKSFSVRRRKPGFGIPWVIFIDPAEVEKGRFFGCFESGEVKELTRSQAFA